MTAARKAQLVWWASKIVEQTEEYADAIDPKRTRRGAAKDLDAINAIARRMYFSLTGRAAPHKV